MAWVESETERFHCRHSSEFTTDAARVLALLERTHTQLEQHFGDQPRDLTIVLHDSPTSLALSNPLMGVSWAATGSAARPYVTGWCGRHELHLLAPAALRKRASATTGSYEMLALAPASLYIRRVIIGGNAEIAARRLPRRLPAELHWAWLLDGISRWLSGESAHARGAITQRMRSNRRPHFPPTAHDSPILAAPLVQLLSQLRGAAAVAELAGRFHRGSSRQELTRAFSGRSLMAVESDWRSELRRVAEGR